MSALTIGTVYRYSSSNGTYRTHALRPVPTTWFTPPVSHLRTFIPRHSKVPPMPKTVKYVSGIKC
jgi:hypothetical protein